MFEPLIIVVSKEEILSEDITTALGALKKPNVFIFKNFIIEL
jgi:hypothetical protein